MIELRFDLDRQVGASRFMAYLGPPGLAHRIGGLGRDAIAALRVPPFRFCWAVNDSSNQIS